jgi:hypothetical protein
LVRLVGISAKRQADAIARAVTLHGELLQRGGIVTVEPGRIRVREP